MLMNLTMKRTLSVKNNDRYVKSSLLFLVIILITIIVRVLLLSHFAHLKEELLISTILGSIIIPIITETVIFLACGNLIISILSLWFSIKTITMNSKILMIIGILFLFPFFLVTIEYLVWILWGGSIPVIIAIALHPCIKIPLFQCCPTISGVLLFISNNQKY